MPVIHDAQDLSIEGLGKAIKALARKARDNQLTPDDVRGGTFTITNPGGYGSIMATPVINLPQVAILDTEAVVKRPVVMTDEKGNDSIAIRHMTYLCMSWDHRALDGALAAQFLARAAQAAGVVELSELWVCNLGQVEYARGRRAAGARPRRGCRTASCPTCCCCSSTRRSTRAAGARSRARSRWARPGTARRASTSSRPTAAAS